MDSHRNLNKFDSAERDSRPSRKVTRLVGANVFEFVEAARRYPDLWDSVSEVEISSPYGRGVFNRFSKSNGCEGVHVTFPSHGSGMRRFYAFAKIGAEVRVELLLSRRLDKLVKEQVLMESANHVWSKSYADKRCGLSQEDLNWCIDGSSDRSGDRAVERILGLLAGTEFGSQSLVYCRPTTQTDGLAEPMANSS